MDVGTYWTKERFAEGVKDQTAILFTSRCVCESANIYIWQQGFGKVSFAILASPYILASSHANLGFLCILVHFQKRDLALTVIGNRLARLFPVDG